MVYLQTNEMLTYFVNILHAYEKSELSQTFCRRGGSITTQKLNNHKAKARALGDARNTPAPKAMLPWKIKGRDC